MMSWVYSASLGRKREMAVYLFDAGGASHFDDRIALFRVGLYTALVNMNPRNLPRSTPNMHLSGLRRRLYYRNAEKTTDRS